MPDLSVTTETAEQSSTDKKRFFRRHPRIALIAINAVLIAILLIIVEVLLRLFLPSYRFAIIGHKNCPNAERYGWGFSPHERIRILAPDSGEVFQERLNNGGWRDVDREIEAAPGTFRILVLGDSITFGAIVAREDLYTRVLERNLRANGCNVEVVSMGYGGWGTDQELEAFRHAGKELKPDLVICQFTKNDLTDNSPGGGGKPFYYTFENDVLQRHEDPDFSLAPETPKDRVKALLDKSEITRRIYGCYQHFRLHEQSDNLSTFRASANQISQVQTVLDLADGHSFVTYLKTHEGNRLQKDALETHLAAAGLGDKTEVILRILEDRWFMRYWNADMYRPAAQNRNSAKWQLYFALIRALRKEAASVSADFAVFCETDQGHVEWELSWYRLADTVEARQNYLSHIQILQSLPEHGVELIPNLRSYARARNDPHPNAAGNQAMAKDIEDYVMKRYPKRLTAQ